MVAGTDGLATTWAEVCFVVPRVFVGRLSAALFEAGSVGLEEGFLPGEAPPVRQPWDTGAPPPLPRRVLLRGWWPGEGFTQRLTGLARLAQPHEAELDSWRMVRDDGWADSWRAGFHRIEISPSLTVAPPWKAQPGDLLIEPGMAFGTGEHPSTHACLSAIARWATPGQRCLDVGCGSGVLALAAAHLGMEAQGVDIDPRAVEAAQSNARLNGLEVRFDTRALHQIETPFDLVVVNLYAELQVSLAPEILRLSASRLVLAGILEERAPMLAPIEAVFEKVQTRHRDGWVCVELER